MFASTPTISMLLLLLSTFSKDHRSNFCFVDTIIWSYLHHPKTPKPQNPFERLNLNSNIDYKNIYEKGKKQKAAIYLEDGSKRGCFGKLRRQKCSNGWPLRAWKEESIYEP